MDSTQIIPLVVVIVYLAAMFIASAAAGAIMRKRVAKTGVERGGQGFLDANKGLNTAMVAAMVAAGAIGGSSTIGVAQNVFTSGMSGAMYTFAWFCAALFLAFVISKPLRRVKMVTLPGIFGETFGGTARLLMIICQLILMLCIIALQFVAGGAILSAMLPQFFTNTSGMILTAVVFVAMTMIGGMLGAGFTNIINCIVIYVGLIFGAISALNGVGGMENLTIQLSTAKPDVPWMSLTAGLGLATIIAWVITQITSVPSAQQNVQIPLSAKSTKTAVIGLVIGAIIILPCGFVSGIFGLVAANQFPDIASASAMPAVAMTLPPVLGGLLLSGLWAADISTGMNILIGSANIITNDIIDILRKDGKKSSVGLTRLVILIVGAITLFMALQVKSILGTLMNVQNVSVGVMVIFLFILYKPSMLRKSSATACLVVNLIIMALWLFVPAIHAMNIIYLCWPVILVTFFITVAVDKRTVEIPRYTEEELKAIN